MTDPAPFLLHASCVAVNERALLILGASGSGKSGLALQLIALGAQLVADDQTLIWAKDGHLIAKAPTRIAGLIEARFLGLLALPATAQAQVALVVDLDQTETDRLPPRRKITLAGIDCALAYRASGPHFTAALYCHLLGDRHS